MHSRWQACKDGTRIWILFEVGTTSTNELSSFMRDGREVKCLDEFLLRANGQEETKKAKKATKSFYIGKQVMKGKMTPKRTSGRLCLSLRIVDHRGGGIQNVDISDEICMYSSLGAFAGALSDLEKEERKAAKENNQTFKPRSRAQIEEEQRKLIPVKSLAKWDGSLLDVMQAAVMRSKRYDPNVKESRQRAKENPDVFEVEINLKEMITLEQERERAAAIYPKITDVANYSEQNNMPPPPLAAEVEENVMLNLGEDDIWNAQDNNANQPNKDDDPSFVLSRANDGDDEMQFVAGGYFEDGRHGVKQNIALSFEWYKKSAFQGNTDALQSVAEFYADGRAGKLDGWRAIAWFAREICLKQAFGYEDSSDNLVLDALFELWKYYVEYYYSDREVAFETLSRDMARTKAMQLFGLLIACDYDMQKFLEVEDEKALSDENVDKAFMIAGLVFHPKDAGADYYEAAIARRGIVLQSHSGKREREDIAFFKQGLIDWNPLAKAQCDNDNAVRLIRSLLIMQRSPLAGFKLNGYTTKMIDNRNLLEVSENAKRCSDLLCKNGMFLETLSRILT